MRAVVIEALGRVPECRDVADPEPPPGWEVARVRAAAIKNIERMLVAGTHYGSARLALPGRVGLDAVVELPDGRRGYAGATPPAGAMAEYLAVDPGRVAEVPAGLDDAVAAALPNAGTSAWFALEYAGTLAAGGTVLVLGATGVTGGLAVQLAARRFGAGRVIAVGRNPARLARLRELGADRVIPIGDDPAALTAAVRAAHREHPIDLVLDYLWGPPAERVLRALVNDDLGAAHHRTRFVQVGESAGPVAAVPAAVLRSAGVELVGQGAGSVPPEAYARIGREVLPALFAMAAAGELVIDTRTVELGRVAEVWDREPASGVRTVLAPRP